MEFASLREEQKAWKNGFRNVACVDEAGVGPLAGPVVAVAVCIISKLDPKLGLAKDSLAKPSLYALPKIRDSKQHTAKQREKLYKILTSHPNMQWGIGIVSEKIIDKINIFQATQRAMKKAVQNLERKLKIKQSSKSHDRRFLNFVDFLIVDGNRTLRFGKISCKAIVKGDEKVFSCAAASIIAKVTRDRIMLLYHKKYPQYEFNKHKGYGTKLHFEMLKKYGSSQIHRKTFYPVSLFRQ